MRVGLLTFHDAINYGAVFQAVALSKTLTKICKEECDIIDYRCAQIDSMYQVVDKNLIKKILKIFYTNAKKKTFRNFVKSNCNLSKKINSISIDQISDSYDCMVVGSDQVWNGNITGHDYNYLLKFAGSNTKRLSYAASIGNYGVLETENSIFCDELAKFSGISVREPAGAKVIQQYTEKDVFVHVDPTLLLDWKEWAQLAKAPKTSEKYIFIYASGNVMKILNTAQMIAKKTGMKIYYMGNYAIQGAKKLSFVSPSEWLGYVQNAECVLTNSFHGTVFSVIFKKNFFVDLGEFEIRNGTKMRHNDRAENLITLMGLENRVIENASEEFDRQIKWNKMENSLLEKKKQAFDYLRTVLGIIDEVEENAGI